MGLDFGTMLDAVLLVVGVIGCKEMLPRWRKDLATVRTPADGTERTVVVLPWVATAIALWCVLSFGWIRMRTLLAAVWILR